MAEFKNKKVKFTHLGEIPYQEAWEYQEKLFQDTIQTKLNNRKKRDAEKVETQNHLLFCYHPHVFTLGKSGKMHHLLVQEKELKQQKVAFFHTNRGGDITYHGPGQLVGYPILDLDRFFTDIHKYLRFLEEAIIQTLAHYHIKSGRIKGLTGVWLGLEENRNVRKICAFGVRSSRWVTMHGFALNVNTDLDFYQLIVPCGIADKGVTSLAKELGCKVDIKEVEEVLKEKLKVIFQWNWD